MTLVLRKNHLLLELPEYTEQFSRPTQSGLEVPTLQSQTYNPVSGKVIQTAQNCEYAQVGDDVFFQIFAFTNGKERCYGDDNPDFDDYKPFNKYCYMLGGKWYMIIPETELYFIFRNGDIIPLNGYTLATQIAKQRIEQRESGLLSVDVSKENYIVNQAVIFRSSSEELNEGDVVQTLKHCDITVEEQLNCPILPKDFFIIETKNIISCTKH